MTAGIFGDQFLVFVGLILFDLIELPEYPFNNSDVIIQIVLRKKLISQNFIE